MLLADKFVPEPRTSPVEEKENFWVARIGEHGLGPGKKGPNVMGPWLARELLHLGNILLDNGRPNDFSHPAICRPRAASAREIFRFTGTGREAAPGGAGRGSLRPGFPSAVCHRRFQLPPGADRPGSAPG